MTTKLNTSFFVTFSLPTGENKVTIGQISTVADAYGIFPYMNHNTVHGLRPSDNKRWYLLTEKLRGSKVKFARNGKGINRN